MTFLSTNYHFPSMPLAYGLKLLIKKIIERTW
jgi:hypothetical protein